VLSWSVARNHIK